jgi:LPS export ABC transporter permease LptG
VRTLSRYVLARYLLAFAGTLLVLVLASAVLELMTDLDQIFEAVQGPRGVAEYIGLRIPFYYLPVLVPAASFVAAYISVGSLARGLEIVAMKASGISPLRAVAPVLVASVLVSVAALGINETVALRAHDAWRRLVRGDDSGLAFQRGSFWYHTGRYVYNLRDADPTSHRLQDVSVFELDAHGRLVRLIEASQAEIGAGDRWHLRDAVIRTFDPDSPTAKPHFARVAETDLTLKNERALLDAGVSGLSIAHLREYRDQLAPGDPDAVRANALLTERLTGPLTAFLFALIAVPLGLRVEQTRSLAMPALQGILLLFLFYVVRQYGDTLAREGITSPAPTAWATLAVFAAVGAVQLARTPR